MSTVSRVEPSCAAIRCTKRSLRLPILEQLKSPAREGWVRIKACSRYPGYSLGGLPINAAAIAKRTTMRGPIHPISVPRPRWLWWRVLRRSIGRLGRTEPRGCLPCDRGAGNGGPERSGTGLSDAAESRNFEELEVDHRLRRSVVRLGILVRHFAIIVEPISAQRLKVTGRVGPGCRSGGGG